MPTVILLDVSLSMCRTTAKRAAGKDTNNSEDQVEIRQLANVGIGTILDYLAQNAQIEYTSLIVFSSLWEIRHQFTRHHEDIKNGIYDLELYDKSNIVNAVRGALSLKLNEWSQNGPINIILITDGQLYHSDMCNQLAKDNNGDDDDQDNDSPNDDFQDIPLAELEGQFDFPCKMQVICLASPRDPSLKDSLPFYKRLVSVVDTSTTECPVLNGTNIKNFRQSAIWLPESNTLDITVESVEGLFTQIAELHYKPYHTILSCGHLSSMVMLSPKPTECLLGPLKNEFDDLKNEESLKEGAKETFVSAINKVRLFKLNEQIDICGFMPLADVASPAVTSRHLILPIPKEKFNETSKAEKILSQDPNAYSKSLQTCGIDEMTSNERVKGPEKMLKASENDTGRSSNRTQATSANETNEQDITKQPSFCVLLHNCLKQENMVAICIVGRNEEFNDDWFGMLHPHSDNRKRSSLMLSLLTPGPSPILWLPNFKSLGSVNLNSELPSAIRDKISSNTTRNYLKSYSSNNVLWLDPESVQADVQKIIRHAKRGVDKVPHFYKELNRIRRAAISYGFYDVLSGLADILEREKRVMKADQSKGHSPETFNHIDHVITCLRSDLTEDSYETNIIPIT